MSSSFLKSDLPLAKPISLSGSQKILELLRDKGFPAHSGIISSDDQGDLKLSITLDPVTSIVTLEMTCTWREDSDNLLPRLLELYQAIS